jgi:hypothetical protein
MDYKFYKILKIIFLSLFFVVFNFELEAQKIKDDNRIYTIAEIQPEYAEGSSALFQWLSKNIDIKLSDNCYITSIDFVIEKNGKISKVVPRLPCGLKNHDKAAKIITIFQKMPNWKPARHNGKLVRFKYTLSLRPRNE